METKIESQLSPLDTVFPRDRLNQSIDPENIFKVRKDNRPIFQLAYDIARAYDEDDKPVFFINGKILDPKLKELAQNYIKAPNSIRLQIKFVMALRESLTNDGFPKESIDTLFKHYSQQPTYGTRRVMDLIQEDYPVSDTNSVHNLSYNQKEGKVCFETKSTGLFIRDPYNSSNNLKDFEGSIQSQFELTDKGFDLVSFSADEECAVQLDKKLIDGKEAIKNMTVGLKKGDNNLFLASLGFYQDYMNNLLKIHPTTMNLSKVQNWMYDKFFKELHETPTVREFQMAKQLVSRLPETEQWKKTFKSYCNLLKESLITHCALMPPAKAMELIEKSYQGNKKEEVKRKYCKYQIEHATEIYNNRVQKKMLEKYPSYKDYLNRTNEYENLPGQGDCLYNQADQNKINEWEDNYKNKIVPEQAKMVVGGDVAHEFLLNIRHTILTTKWELGILGGTSIEDKNGNEIAKVPSNMVAMLDIIEEAIKKNPTGESSEIWIKAFEDVARTGKTAFNTNSFFRDAKTQDFYKTFVTSYSNIPSEGKDENEEDSNQFILR